MTDAEKQARVASVLAPHIGRENGISAEDLAAHCELTERELRHVVTELREQGIAVCATPGTGYFVAADAHELEHYYCKFLEERAIHSLRLIARARRVALPELLGQLRLKS